MKRYLFVCSQNKLRSPSAEQIFSDWPGIEVVSAGTNHDAENPLTPELVRWADVVVVMEKTHRSKLQRKFRSVLSGQRVICLDVPDNYKFMEPALIDLLKAKMLRFLPAG